MVVFHNFIHYVILQIKIILFLMDKKKLWQAVLAQVQTNISEASFNTWFRNTDIQLLEKERITISVPNSFVKEWLENKYNKIIFKTVRDIKSDVREINYIINNSAVLPLQSNDNKEKEANTNSNQLEFQEFVIDNETGLNPKYEFSNFIIGPFNELAHAAAYAVAENPGSIYNPLFVYGKTGLGKTHLIQALGNEIKNNKNKKKVKYIQAQKFISGIVSGIRNQTIESFKAQYKDIDVLIIDDIQFLSGKEKTQEEFFHTFNDLYEKNKQIILSSDRPPKAISSLTDRLRSRFEGGMIADINYPDTETRVAIFKTKAEEKGFYLNNEVCIYIAENVQKNIREMEGVLNKLIIYERINKKPIDIISAKKVLKNILRSPIASVSVNKITKAVTDFYDISEKDITSSSRRREIVKPRNIIIYFMRKELEYSFPYIGKKMGGRDHTTIMHSYQKIEKELISNEEIREELSLIKQTIFSM